MRSVSSDTTPETTETATSDRAPAITPLKIDQFWHYDEQLESSLVVIAPPPSTETILDVLGPISVKPETSPSAATAQASTSVAIDHLRSIYTTASQQAVLAAMNTTGS
jgi:uncharacterized Zn finger protein